LNRSSGDPKKIDKAAAEAAAQSKDEAGTKDETEGEE